MKKFTQFIKYLGLLTALLCVWQQGRSDEIANCNKNGGTVFRINNWVPTTVKVTYTKLNGESHSELIRGGGFGYATMCCKPGTPIYYDADLANCKNKTTWPFSDCEPKRLVSDTCQGNAHGTIGVWDNEGFIDWSPL